MEWFLLPWDSPGKSTGVGCHFLLQGIFPTRGSNPGLPHCKQTLYPLNHQGPKRSYSSKLLLFEIEWPQQLSFALTNTGLNIVIVEILADV